MLLKDLQEGVPEAFEMLYHHFVGRVLGLSRQLLKDPVLAEDAAQETFIRIYKNVHRFRGDARLSTWIHRIATNVCLTELKRRSKAPQPVETPPRSAQAAPGSELRVSLSEILHRLEPRKQVAFYLCHVEGLSAAEIATVLQESRAAVLKRLQRARQELLAMWHQAVEHPQEAEVAKGWLA